MRKFAFVLAVSCAACFGPPPSGPVAGKAYFVQAGCAACHRVGSLGDAVGPDLTFVGFRHSPQWLDLWIGDPRGWKPDTLMPDKRLSRAARAAIVSYLAEQRGQEWPKGLRPWDALSNPLERGRLIYLRAGCAACHGQGGAGGYPNNNVPGGKIPALIGVGEGYTKAELVAKIRDGVPAPAKADPDGPAPLVGMPAWGEVLDGTDLDAVASYLLSLKAGDAQKTDW